MESENATCRPIQVIRCEYATVKVKAWDCEKHLRINGRKIKDIYEDIRHRELRHSRSNIYEIYLSLSLSLKEQFTMIKWITIRHICLDGEVELRDMLRQA